MTRLAEPEWDDASRDLALALEDPEGLLCSVCGRPKTVCQDPARQHEWDVGAPVRCHATTAVHEAQERFRKTYNEAAHLDALVWPIRLRDTHKT